MTASISTRGMKCASFSDEEREKMYFGTLKYYDEHLLSDPCQQIVFVDNSGWNLVNLKRAISDEHQHQVEFISLDPVLFDISKGKGYNELLLINNALEKSKFIKECGVFFKVTGRYSIYNVGYFIKKAYKKIVTDGQDFYGDMKDHCLYDLLRLGWCGHSGEARLFGSKTEFFQQKIGSRYSELNDYKGKLVEGLLFDVMKSSQNITKRFKREPHMGGLEGSNINAISFSKQQDSMLGKFKRYIGNFIRVCLPFFWF